MSLPPQDHQSWSDFSDRIFVLVHLSGCIIYNGEIYSKPCWTMSLSITTQNFSGQKMPMDCSIAIWWNGWQGCRRSGWWQGFVMGCWIRTIWRLRGRVLIMVPTLLFRPMTRSLRRRILTTADATATAINRWFVASIWRCCRCPSPWWWISRIWQRVWQVLIRNIYRPIGR